VLDNLAEQVPERADDLRGLEAVEGPQDSFQLQHHGQGHEQAGAVRHDRSPPGA
jgi:hypothetical protein